MGIRTKRKEVTAMRRMTSLTTALLFTACMIFNTTFSFAEPTFVTKDTSWFNYRNPKDSYKISTEAQLMGLCSLVNEEQVDRWKPDRLETFEGVTFVLTRDIELTQPWTPIGLDDSVYFAGVFDGNGHTISNLNIKEPVDASGLFGYLVGEVRDLKVEGSNDSNYSNTGGIAGTLSKTGSITGCSSDVKITGKDKTGGIVGNNEGGNIEGCVNLGDVSGTFKVGGVVGENWGGTVSQCGNKGSVKSTRRGVATYGTGGVAGRSVSTDAVISECYNTGEINSNTEATGGVVGYMNALGSAVEDCYNTGMINIRKKNSGKEISPAYAGGIAGIAGIYGVIIQNCYNAGAINNADTAGGILGKYQNETENDKDQRYIRNNYYVSTAADSGIGFMEDKKDKTLKKSTISVSEGSIHNLMTSLSVAYTRDNGSFGNNGYPVLRWQEPMSTMEKTYFDDIPEDIQRDLDKYLVKNAAKHQYGQLILDIMSPHNSTTNAFILYNEAQDKMKNINNTEEQNDER